MLKVATAALSLITLLSSCGYSPVDVPNSYKMKISYIRDARTGLCFATSGSFSEGGYTVVSISCVPCDSLNRVSVTTLGATVTGGSRWER
jgi:hypothetical protein